MILKNIHNYEAPRSPEPANRRRIRTKNGRMQKSLKQRKIEIEKFTKKAMPQNFMNKILQNGGGLTFFVQSVIIKSLKNVIFASPIQDQPRCVKFGTPDAMCINFLQICIFAAGRGALGLKRMVRIRPPIMGGEGAAAGRRPDDSF